jgi:hypothetical protein
MITIAGARPPLRLLLLVIAALAPFAAHAGSDALSEGWMLERGTAEPSYAAVVPTRTNVNIDTVVLACEQGWGERLLQLQLYLTDEGVLRPIYPHARPLNDGPRAEASIDGKVFPVALLFAEDHVVLADTQVGPFPLLSDAFLDAVQAGRTMTLRFDHLAEWSGASTFDSEAVVDLQAPGGRAAIAAVRRCAEPGDEPRTAGNFVGIDVHVESMLKVRRLGIDTCHETVAFLSRRCQPVWGGRRCLPIGTTPLACGPFSPSPAFRKKRTSSPTRSLSKPPLATALRWK